MQLTFADALRFWARFGGPMPIRTGNGPYAYRMSDA